MNVLRTKSIEQSLEDTEEPEGRLRRSLGPLDLTVLGVGVTVGAGIFVLTGVVAGTRTGPAISLSFVFASIACALAALCYAEFASMVPVAGSAYTFSYATLGEIVAWIVGWDLILELMIGASTVAVGWSHYLGTVFAGIGITLPGVLTGAAKPDLGAALIVLVLTGVLVLGVKLSARVNFVIVLVKVAVVLFVIVAGSFYVKRSNWSPFIPPAGSPAAKSAASGAGSTPLVQSLFGYHPGTFGWGGVFAGAALVFFAFIGFDVVATAAEETKKPKRDVPIGIIASLAIVTVLYVAVSLVVTGMQRYNEIDTGAPLATAFTSVGRPGFATVVSLGALAGLTTVMLILMMGQSRIFFAMSRDKLLPPTFSKVSPRFGTPYRSTVLVGGIVAVVSALVPLGELAELVNIGTLAAFILVSIGVVVLRRKRPDLQRAFRTPLVPLLPILAVLACLWLAVNLPVATWIRFGVWMVIGFALYFTYGARRSRLATGSPESAASEMAMPHSIDLRDPSSAAEPAHRGRHERR